MRAEDRRKWGLSPFPAGEKGTVPISAGAAFPEKGDSPLFEREQPGCHGDGKGDSPLFPAPRAAFVALACLLAACRSVSPPRDDSALAPTPLAADFATVPAGEKWSPQDGAGSVAAASRGHGDASLAVRFVDADSGAAAGMSARLWRLGVAADAAWTAGDHVQAAFVVDDAAARIDGLPTGRYRLQLDEQRRGAPDPPEFVVGEGETRLEFRVRAPRRFHAWLVVVDEEGRRIERGRLAVGSIAFGAHQNPPPEWAHLRRPADGSDPPRARFFIADGRGVFEKPRVAAVASERGFDLGEFMEPTRVQQYADYEAAFECDGRTGVRVRLSNLTGETTFGGLSASLDDVFADVQMPDGSRADPTRATKLVADGQAVVLADSPPAEWQRTCDVQLRFTVPACEPYSFTWSPATAGRAVLLTPSKR